MKSKYVSQNVKNVKLTDVDFMGIYFFFIFVKIFPVIAELQLQCLMRRGSAGTPSLPTWVMTVIQIFYALVCLAGLVGNSLVIYVVLRYDPEKYFM